MTNIYNSYNQNTLLADRNETLKQRQSVIFNKLETGLEIRNVRGLGTRVHFQNSHLIPVQRWYPYREGYSLDLVTSYLTELNVTGVTFDPFCGSGTTLLASRMGDLKSFGIDINPISVLVSKVENEQYSSKEIQLLVHTIQHLKDLSISVGDFVTSFNLAEKVFNRSILQALLAIKNFVRTIENERIRNLVFVAWLSIIEKVSNIKKEGNGIKYKNRKRTSSGYIDIDKGEWEKSYFPEDKFEFVKHAVTKQLEIMLDDLKNNYGHAVIKPGIFNGNCLEFDQFFNNEIEFTFFSPPYCNCFDYFEIHKVELWLSDFVTNHGDLNTLRTQGFRSNINSLDHKSVVYKNENIESLISLFDSDNLWSKKIPGVVRGYFDDFHTLLHKLYRQTKKAGSIGIVVGNSAYSGVIIPTDILIAQIAQEMGFEIKNISVARHLTTSSQQKTKLESLNYYLRESIVLLQK